MLLPYLPYLNKKKIILGSQSKSRNELLQSQKLKYERISSSFEENLCKQSYKDPSEYNLETCRGKVNQLTERFNKDKFQWDLLICGDTIVVYDGKIIQKPENQDHCVKMMGDLSNHTHYSYTANMIVFNCTPEIRYQWVTKANVTFADIPKQVLIQFAKTDEPYIHSGGYQLTAISASFIAQINGSHTAVQGLDIAKLCQNIIKGAKQAKWIQ